MGTQGTGRKRSTKKERSTAEDDALNLIAREAEARLAAKRAARAEAREIRMKELERQQKELSDDDERMSVGSRGSVRVEDRDYLEKGSRAASALTAATLTSLGGTSSRRGSGDTAVTADTEASAREIKDALAQVEEKYRKAMVSNAQLDNEKNNLMYQVDTLKDSLMELEELLSESRREYEEKVKEFEREKHAHSVLQFQFNEMKEMLKQSEELLNKHGIVLGPDLNINGDSSEAEVDGSPSGDSTRQPAEDSQTPPTEGNSMLGNTEEAQLRSSGEEEVDPEEQQEMLKEEAKDNQLSSDTLCNVADVSTLETSSEEQPAEEQQICSPTEEDSVGERDLSSVDSNDRPITEAKDIVCSSEAEEVVTSAEDKVRETGNQEGGDSGETSNPEETETKSSVDFRETCNRLGEEQEEESTLKNTESCPQQEVSEENCHETTSAVSNTIPQQEPENAEEAENDEAEEMSSKSQSTTTPGKKTKKKRRRKKKGGNQQKDSTGKENSKMEQDLESAKRDNGSTTEPETLKESKMKDGQETEDVDAAKPVEPSETVSCKDTFKELRMDHVTNKHEKEQTLETDTVEDIKVVAPTETIYLTETAEEMRVDHVTNKQTGEGSLESEIVDNNNRIIAVAQTETFSCAGSLKGLRTEPTEDKQNQEQSLETEKVENVDLTTHPEASLSASDPTDTCNSTENSDGLDKEYPDRVDDAVSGDMATNGEGLCKESDAYGVEDEAGSLVEMKAECTDDNPENSLEISSKENTETDSHASHNGDVTADESESMNSPEREDLISVLPPCAGDLTDGLKSCSDSEPPSEPSVARNLLSDEVSDEGPQEESETVKDEEQPGIETEKDCVPPSVLSPGHDGGDSELNPDGPQKVELNRDWKEPEDLVEPDSSSHEVKGDSASLKESEESLLETETQVEPLEVVESQTCECEEKTDDSNVSLGTGENNTTDVLNTPASLTEATETGSSVKDSPDTDATTEDPEQKLDQNYQESETSLPPLVEKLPESSNDKSQSQPTQQESDEEDGEDEEGQSFDFDDLDVEAAVESNLLKDQEESEGVEITADESTNVSSELCQSNTETDENTQNKPVRSNDDDDGDDDDINQIKTLDKESDAGTQDNQNSLAHGEATAEVKPLNDGELGVVTENIIQTTTLPVEEGLDAIKNELQGDNLVLPNSADQVTSNKEPPQSGKDVRKNNKKGKGKGKEDCKMS